MRTSHTVVWVSLAACLGAWVVGCTNVYEEIRNPPKQAGGTIKVQIDAGPERSTTGLGRNKVEPFTVEGQSTNLTFALTAAEETSGSTAKQKLAGANTSAELVLSATGRNRIEVHSDGSGCVSDGKTGYVTLSLGDSSRLSGTFELGGIRSGTTTACVIKGSLTDVPVTNE